jgi:hypothetical protein
MCEKCVEIDKKLERFERLEKSINDEQFVGFMKQMISELTAQKLALHPELKDGSPFALRNLEEWQDSTSPCPSCGLPMRLVGRERPEQGAGHLMSFQCQCGKVIATRSDQ